MSLTAAELFFSNIDKLASDESNYLPVGAGIGGAVTVGSLPWVAPKIATARMRNVGAKANALIAEAEALVPPMIAEALAPTRTAGTPAVSPYEMKLLHKLHKKGLYMDDIPAYAEQINKAREKLREMQNAQITSRNITKINPNKIAKVEEELWERQHYLRHMYKWAPTDHPIRQYDALIKQADDLRFGRSYQVLRHLKNFRKFHPGLYYGIPGALAALSLGYAGYKGYDTYQDNKP